VEREKLFEKVENKLEEEQPDSAYLLLNTILYPEKLNKSQFNRYALLRIQARDKSDRDITSDTIIFSVRDYYVRKKDFLNATLAAFYCGRVLYEQNDIKRAMEAYLEAEKWSEFIENDNLKGLIQGNLGILHTKQLLCEKAIPRGQKAAAFYHKAQNYKNEINALLAIGNCFFFQKESDSAFYYYNEGLKLADYYKIPTAQANVRQSIGVVYGKIGKYADAKKLFREALSFCENKTENARIRMNLAKVYFRENQLDSAKFYIEQSLSIGANEPALTRSTYFLLSEMEEKKGRYKEALQHYKAYNDLVVKVVGENENKALLELQEKYNFATLQSKNDQLVIEKQKIILISTAVLALIIIAAFFFYRKSIQNKKAVLEANQTIESLRKMAQNYQEDKDSSKSILVRHFDVLRKVALIEKDISEGDRKKGEHLIKKINKIVYEQDQLDWDKLYHTMNRLGNGFYDRIREQYSQLDDLEFRICCLTCEKFSSEEIAVIMNLSANAVHKKISAIRKKIGALPYSSIYTFFQENLVKKVTK
jgi:tetratricopeptide (TPR) repeat protein